MLKNITLACCLLYALLVGSALQAEVLDDLYSAQVRVQSQSQAALAKGAQEALGQVLVKASGSPEVLGDDIVAEELRNARNHVQQYAYERRARSEAGDEELWARFEFSPSFVTTLIKRVGAPLWTANRPAVLVWLVMDDQQLGRYFLDEEVAPDLTEELFRAFSYRGVPARLPLFDLADTAAMSPEDAWQLQPGPVLAASSRYDLGDVVLARVAKVSEGRFVGDWSYMRGSERIERSISGATLAEFLQQGAGLVADDMAARFAVTASDMQGDSLLISILGIENYSDYASVISWIESLELVENATVERIEGEKMVLRIEAQADPVQLSTLIGLNRRLEPVPVDGFNPQDAPQLSYLWRKSG